MEYYWNHCFDTEERVLNGLEAGYDLFDMSIEKDDGEKAPDGWIYRRFRFYQHGNCLGYIEEEMILNLMLGGKLKSRDIYRVKRT